LFEAAAGTIRGDFGCDLTKNLIHGSDSPERAAREIGIFVEEKELVEYELTTSKWT